MKCKRCGKEYPKRTGSYCGACLPESETDKLRARVAELEAALKPFVAWYEKYVSCDITFAEAKNKLCERYFIDATKALKGGE